MNPRRIAVNPNPNIDRLHFNLKTIILVGYSKVVLYTKFEHALWNHLFLTYDQLSHPSLRGR